MENVFLYLGLQKIQYIKLKCLDKKNNSNRMYKGLEIGLKNAIGIDLKAQ